MDETGAPRAFTWSTWTIAAIVAGTITLIALVILATLAVAMPGPMSRGYALLLTVAGVLGIATAGLVISERAVSTAAANNRAYAREVSERVDEYQRGVSDTIDRLAQALPSQQSIRRVS